ncbi:MAG: hypothetical protein F4W90_03845 [Gammaproteobacteria bacterium]|nr:hypothetical protein [Gammaproteobacteria bacterium]
MTTLFHNRLFALLAFVAVSLAMPTSAQDIWTVANEGDVKTLKQLLKDGQDVDAKDPSFGFSALNFAVLGNQPKAVRLLLKHGADVNGGSLDGNTPLHAASFLGYDKVAKELLRAGADPMQANGQGQIPGAVINTDWQTTQYIASMLQIEVVEADVNAGREKIGEQLEKATQKLARSDIWVAVLTGNDKYVKRLARKTEDLNALNEESQASLLSIAAIFGFSDVVETLIDAGADVDQRGGDGATPLLVAAFFGREEVVKILLANGADQSLTNNEGSTPLAAAQADMAFVDMLAGLLNIQLNYDEVIAGKKAVVTMLSSN